MLVLTRKRDESIDIGNDIQVIVLGVHGERTKIGIKAPANTPILRSEVARERRKSKADDILSAPHITVVPCPHCESRGYEDDGCPVCAGRMEVNVDAIKIVLQEVLERLERHGRKGCEKINWLLPGLYAIESSQAGVHDWWFVDNDKSVTNVTKAMEATNHGA